MSYDSVAQIYEKVAVPWFSPIAADLVAAVDPDVGDIVLDLGTGTGLVASLASDRVAPTGLVLGLDPSAGMLRLVAPATGLALVAGMAPGLPCRRNAGDVVVANLVLSHLPDLDGGLADVVGVIRPGGRMGCTAWAPPVDDPDNAEAEADEIVESVFVQLGFSVPPPDVSAVPWEQQLKAKGALLGVLAGAGLTDLHADSHRYTRAFSVEELVSGWGSRSRHRRHVLGEERWAEFARRASDALRDRFGEEIRGSHDAWIVTGRRALTGSKQKNR